MAKVGRNAPCPCGSGKKYKKCCWSRDRAVAAQAARENANRPPPSRLSFPEGFPSWDDEYWDDGLTELSNRVVDLINAGEYEDAEGGCLELKEKYPDAIDWLDRRAMLHEAKGETDLAIEYYERCLAFAAQYPGDYESDQVFQDAITRLRNDPTSKPPWLGVKPPEHDS